MAATPEVPPLSASALRQLPIVLVGYRGTGKSTIGPLVAERLARSGVWSRFADTDDEVEATTGLAIASIFATEGEAAFRKRESRALRSCLRTGGVIATGGGVVVAEANRKRLAKCRGIVVWLQAPAKVIAERIAGDDARPALTSLSPLDEVRTKLAERDAWYRGSSTHQIDTSRVDAATAAETIVSWWRAKLMGAEDES